MAWTWKYSSAYNFGGYKEYRAWIGYDQTNYDTYSRIWWSIGVQMKYGSEYGVTAVASGAASGSCEGYLSSSPGGSWKDVCRKDGYFDVTRSTSKQSKTVTSTAKGKTVSGYGSAGGSGVSVSHTWDVPALASYTVAFNANGGSGAPGTQTKWYGKTLVLSSAKPTRSGYTFIGWSTSSTATSATYAAGSSYTANSAATLYAIWKKNLTLSYNANGGSGAPAAQSATVYNATTSYRFTIPSTKPSRERYNFLGWATSSGATTAAYQPGGTYTISSNATLYAVWEIAYIPPTIGPITAYRVDNTGTEDNEGTFAHITFDWSIDTTYATAVEGITIEGKVNSDTEWTQLWSSTPNDTTGSVAISVLEFPSTGFDKNKTYDLRVIVADDIGSTTTKSFLSQAFYTMHFKPGGKGVAFGAPATYAGFYCAMDMYVKSVGNGNRISLLDAIYPIGSIFLSTNSINPSTLLGGTWVPVTVIRRGTAVVRLRIS